MKKTFKTIESFLILAAAALTVVGCQKNVGEEPAQEGLYKYSFALVEDDTKAVIGDSSVEWVAGDQVGVFIGEKNSYAKIDVSTTPKMAILYSNSAIPAGTMAYAYAPYDKANDDVEMAKITLSGVQSGSAVSAMPLAGVPFKVEAEIDPKAQTGNGAIKFLNLGSLVNFKVFSSDEAFRGETVKSVKFEASKPIAGVGYIDLTAVDAADEGTLELLMDEEETTVRVDQDAAIPAAKEDAEPIKMVVLPGTFEGILTVTTDVATYLKEIPEREFARSHSRTFNVDLAKAERSEGVEEVVVGFPYDAALTSKGDFTVDNVVLPDGLNAVWTFDATFGAKASAFVDPTYYATESWLVSPWVDLSEVTAAAVSFDHVHRYAVVPAEELTLWAKSDGEGAGWAQLTIPTYASGTNWTFVNSGDISLKDYVGKKVKVAFKYTSTDAKAATWEVKNFSVHILKLDPGLAYEVTEFTADVSDNFNAPTLVNPYGLDVTYSSSNEEVALVDEKTGEVVLMGDEGVVTITASFEGNEAYKAGSASYTITVSDASIEPETFFYESFDEFDKDGCTGGNDGQWSGSIGNFALTSVVFDESGWTYKSANAAYRCAKVGSSSADGWMTTRTIAVNGKAKLSFKAAGWGSGTNKFTVTASGATISGDTSVTVSNASWNDYFVKISDAKGEVVLTFTGSRFFLDEVAVYTGDAPVKPSERLNPELSFEGDNAYVVEPNGEFNAPKLINPHNLSVTYSSSNEEVALVDETTGEVLIGEKEGKTVITATFVGSAAYLPGSASYSITVRAEGSGIVDVLDRAFTGVSGTVYTNWSGKVGTSGAVYAGNSAGGKSSIQMRTDNSNSGIVTTTSGGKASKVVVTWNLDTARGRTLQIYGSDKPYESASDLYSEETQGKLIGKLIYYPDDKEDVMELTFEEGYKYIGFRSASGAMYITEIDITWE